LEEEGMKINKKLLWIGSILFCVIGIIYLLRGYLIGGIVELGVALLLFIGFLVKMKKGKA
jgi:hypothetical protein